MSGPLFAQKPWEFGVDASLDVNFLGSRKSLDATAHPKLGYAVHGHAQRQLRPHLGLDIALGYAYVSYAMIMRGITFNDEIGSYPASMTLDIRSHQLQAPILLKHYLKSREKGMYFGLGPMLGLTLANHSSGLQHHATGLTNAFAYDGRMNNFQLALQGCVGHRFQVVSHFDLGLEVYANASLGYLTWAPLRPITSGLRLSGWF